MAIEKMRSMKPFISVLIIILTLLVVVFCKMEIRRLGYSILKVTQIEKKLRDQKKQKLLTLAKLKRPSHVDQVAKNMTLRKPDSSQVILLTGIKEN